jgi:hypothetical protein
MRGKVPLLFVLKLGRVLVSERGGVSTTQSIMEEHYEREPHSARHIYELLDNLICALYEQRAIQPRLYEFILEGDS